VCCVKPGTEPVSKGDASSRCTSVAGSACGSIGGYGQRGSQCCNEGNASGVVVCDTSFVSLTYTLCDSPYICVEHSEFHGKRDGDDGEEEDIYAQCERSG
jgi:hypothetical protein